MDIILVPGFWLDASSWAEVTPALEAAGHRPHPLTLPGLESVDSSRAGIGLQDHIDAVVQAVDAIGGKVVLVGHSGGGAIIHGAVDARPDKVERAIYVDSGPLGEGGVINDELPAEGDDIPLPPWESFDDADLLDLDDGLRRAFRARAVPEPRGVAYGRQHLHDERRYAVPATVIACEFPAALLREWIAAASPFVAELARVHDVDYVDLPTGHWPQFTKPAELARAILAAVDRSGMD
ncbi:pimeloyl-ACP methyl ester carboxylesterase [Arthrobacter sp. AG258]|uniref:alpha/beta fold hydrolase n=1 Tax=Arthrobacter sp. AG258 TaxID=2183899 RepID=UPI001061336F|nr:alpha/beta hydrolase [Arthrobacter sp. AG258]TDT81908.1 pimeloyl-ACP methyl ester carboxylesterase [Arthrobacter sp. AG258]